MKMREQNKKEKQELKKVILEVIAVIIVTLFFLKHVIGVGNVPSGSMYPEVKPGDYFLTNNLAYIASQPKRGDIVSFKSKELKIGLMKRVVGLPGDEISFADGFVYINGEPIVEEYLADDVYTYCPKKFTVPEGCYFMMGDNREESYDSRYWKNPYIPKRDIEGKLIVNFHLGRNKS